MQTDLKWKTSIEAVAQDTDREEFIKSLTRLERKDLKSGLADLVRCAKCNKFAYYGRMNMISLAISGREYTCPDECS